MHNVAETLSAQAGSPVYLCLNATRTVTTAVAVQFVAQALHVLGDWIREREPGAVVGEIIRDARLQICYMPGRRILNAMTQSAFVGRLRACRRNCGPEVPSIREVFRVFRTFGWG